jgi:signal transduction histidine kinase
VQVLSFLPGVWSYAGVAAVATLLAVAGVRTGGPFPALLPGLIINVLLVSAIGLFIRSIALQSERRKQALAELAEANTRLAEYAEENAELQARLIAQAREAGVRAERERLAGEIHDTIAQGLTGIITQLEAASQVAEHPQTRQRLSNACALARESLAEARRSVQALRPEPLEVGQLPDAVSDVADRWSTAHGIPVDVSVTGTARALHPEVEVTLLRVVQEGLANVARHAHAGKVGVTLSYMEDVVVLDVRDDGCGFDTGAASSGFGLVAMRARVTRLGGHLAVESAPGQGTAVSASVMAIPVAVEPAP